MLSLAWAVLEEQRLPHNCPVGLAVPQLITLTVSAAGICFLLPDSGKGAWTLLQMRQLCLIAEAPSVATGER